MTTPHEISALLRQGRYRQGSEAHLQEDVGQHLGQAGVWFEREFVLSPGERIDFMLDEGIGIECKVRAGKRAIFRQLERYAALDAIRALILVTGTAMGLPALIGSKPVFYVSLGRCSL